MAEETIRLPNSPDVNRSWRRISTGKLSFLYTEEKLLPNYLRSPTGSCHDACKYGRKDEPEDKPRVSSLKRVNRSFSGTLNLDSPLRKKALTKSVLTSLGSVKCDSANSFDHSKSQVGNFSTGICDVRKKKKAVPMSESRVADSSNRKKKKTVSKSFITVGESRRRANEIVEHNKRVTALKLKSVAQTAALALHRSTLNRKKINAAEPKKGFVLSRAPISPKRCSRSLREKKISGGSLSVPLIKSQKQVDEKCKDLAEEKTLYVIEMNTGSGTVESDQNQRCVMDSRTDDPPSAQIKSQDDEAEDSVIEVPETEADNKSSEQEEEEYDDDGDNASLSEDKNIKRQVRSKALSAESDINGKSMKLRFKRGKVVEFGSQENSPRKIKFKKGKIVTGADTNSKSSSRRSLKTKGNNFSNDKEQQHKPKSLEVILKHQETQKHRDSRALLFNNVIEETANKLVETRKSKVKALVGAFESVISLQDKNSSATNITDET